MDMRDKETKGYYNISDRKKFPQKLIRRLEKNFEEITNFYMEINKDSQNETNIPEYQWLLDNYYIVEEQINELKLKVKKNKFLRLEIIDKGPFEGYPRAFAITLDYINRNSGKLDEIDFIDYIRDYQKSNILSIGEVWSLAIMMRIALVDYIHYICRNIKKADKISEEREDWSVYLGNCITSLRMVALLDWKDIFESICVINKILLQDPSGIYEKMDFDSRDYYRKEIELISEKIGVSESIVTKKAIELSKKQNNYRERHVGYYLVDVGRKKLFKGLNYNSDSDYYHNYPVGAYVIPIIILSLIGSLIFGIYGYRYYNNIAIGIVFLFMAFIPVSSIAVTILNWIIIHRINPVLLPKLEYKSEIPEESTTLVVIPSLITDTRGVEELTEQLEVHYLSNKEKNIYFAIAGDFKDNDKKIDGNDQEIIRYAKEKIQNLNKKYSHDNEPLFYYFHRARSYVEVEKKWMGWERKRGALVELNRVLTGTKDTSYNVIYPEIDNIKDKIKYIITVDADTRMPFDTAKKLIGTISHPLNKAYLDSEKGIVTKGYGIIQPRIGINIESINESNFAKIFAGQGGLDPYTTAASDVYQDLFREGIFTGKGIYDLHIFNKVLDKAIPENKVLSHDLLEGSYIRTGLATDIVLYDDYPKKYISHIKRQHRWIRGDWQIISWLSSKSPINRLSKWKILDNIRRSIFEPSLVLLILLGGFLFPKAIGTILLLTALIMFFPFFIDIVGYFYDKQYKNNKGNMIQHLYRTILNIIFLFHRGYVYSDAIIRAIYRMGISKKNILQWTTAKDVEKKSQSDLMGYIRKMNIGILVPILYLAYIFVFKISDMYLLVPLLVLWTISPYIAYTISKDKEEEIVQLEEKDKNTIRRIARKTWDYYEEFVNESSNFLPPDNYQEEPKNAVDYRTSPTNIGFLLISIVGAVDLGYITITNMVEKLINTINTLKDMETYRGHLYNWYDIKTLEPLKPVFISTVDSGNFASYLLVLKQGLIEYKDRPLINKAIFDGLKDTLYLAGYEDKKDSDIFQLIDFEYNYSIEKTIENLNKLLEEINGEEKWILKFRKMVEAILKDIDMVFLDESKVTEIMELENNRGLDDVENELNKLDRSMSLKDLKKLYKKLLDSAGKNQNLREYILKYIDSIDTYIDKIDKLINDIQLFFDNMEFRFLYDDNRNLLSVGYDVEEGKLIPSFYDLLASEARVSSFIAISKGEIPVKHWFKLSRALTSLGKYRSLVSWTGTMFEYFMPLLVFKNKRNTLFDETYNAVIMEQKKYARIKGIPWGISESGYFGFDINYRYQYKAFGVPDLGLKRGLGEDIVVSPYSSLLALSVSPKDVAMNINRLIDEQMEGEYGLYEAMDYTTKRVPKGEKKGLVKSYMAHHQGMGFVAIVNYICEDIIKQRFHREPMVKAGEILLEEKVPLTAVMTKQHKEDVGPINIDRENYRKENVRIYTEEEGQSLPHCHLISNGKYTVLLTHKGTGYSKFEDIQITRWRKDILLEQYGTFIFIKNLKEGLHWSTGTAPIDKVPDGYKVVFSDNKAKYIRLDNNIETVTEVIVAPEDNIEIRRVTLNNHSTKDVEFQVTSYMEPVIGSHLGDLAHSAFSNLFVRTDFIKEYNTLLAWRRPRIQEEDSIWAIHKVVLDEELKVDFETNRDNFIGRGKDISSPKSINTPLTNTKSVVLDPVMSLRTNVNIKAGKKYTLSFITGIAEDKKSAIRLARKYENSNVIDKVFENIQMKGLGEYKYLNIPTDEITLYQELLPHILFNSPTRRNYKEFIVKNIESQRGLWKYGISGDNPITLVSVSEDEDMDIVDKTINAHSYWRILGIETDLVFLINSKDVYFNKVRNEIRERLQKNNENALENVSGGIFIIDDEGLSQEDRCLIFGSSKLILDSTKGPIEEQIKVSVIPYELPKIKKFYKNNIIYVDMERDIALDYYNGYGGFSKDGREYIITLKDGFNTPAPWVNVLSNKKFGCIVTESGSGFTWSENSQKNRLTQWSNDPVTDPPQEIIYIRDEETGDVWSITPLPIREKGKYIIRHGKGYTTFEHNTHGFENKLTVFVPEKDSVKVNLINIKNVSGFSRRLTLTYFVRPVLGENYTKTNQHIKTWIDEDTGTFCMDNKYSIDYSNNISFLDVSNLSRSYTGNEWEFIGADGSIDSPEALKRDGLSNETGIFTSPCGCVQTSIEIGHNQDLDISFIFGQESNMDTIKNIAHKYRDIQSCKEELDNIKQYWLRELSSIQIETPDKSMDLMINGWLMYQNIACRIWARSAFYQSGGAYGFRDQLQDSVNAIYLDSELTKKQILLHCRHQFKEGDVQHWWHPGGEDQGSPGIRTRFSDDLLWLAFGVLEYIEITGDYDILDEKEPFIEGELLKEGEDEKYGIPAVSSEVGTVYDHINRSINRGLKYGVHGIPLMGSGDWNDGMNMVGNEGRGESIWLGWFISYILSKMIPLCERLQDYDRVEYYSNELEKIGNALENEAWDGSWYRRAYFDDGTPLGSRENEECMIDSLAQSWSVISGNGDKSKSIEAMSEVESHLVKYDNGMVLLFTPAFDHGALNPGYIKGYVPGVRENGGQYTHAATWVISAFALLGEGDKASRIFNMINPINHSRTPIETSNYKVEPYVVAADVYYNPQHIGRGGWTWYTGAAGWMYRVGVRDILGFRKMGKKIKIEPCIPKVWNEYKIDYRYEDTNYHIIVKNPYNVNRNVKYMIIDGKMVKDNIIELQNDKNNHHIEVVLG